LVFEDAGMVAQVVGGPNRRVDFHDDRARSSSISCEATWC
jgi:hypothetical protein